MGRLRARGRFPLTEQRFQEFFEGAAAAQDARFHRTNAAFQHFGDFFVAQAFQVAKDYSAAKDLRNFLQSVLHRLLNFVGGELIERGRAQIFDLDSVVPLFGLRVDGDVFFANGV